MNLLNYENIAAFFILFTGSVSLLIALGELLVKHRDIENYIFASLLFIFGILALQMCFIAEKFVIQHPWLLFGHFTFLYLVAPAGYFAYFLTVLPSDKLPKKMFLYLVPSVIALILDLCYMAMSPDAQRAFLDSLLYSGTVEQNLPVRILLIGAGIQLFAYLGFLLYRFLMIWIRKGRARVILISMGYLAFTIVTGEMVIAGHILPSPWLIKWGACLISLVLPSAFLVSQRFPRFLRLIREEAEKGAYARSLLTGLDVDRIIGDLKKLMDEKELFLNEELSLKDLAGEVSITTHQLSQLLNERLSTSFNNYVNQYRIEYSKRLLIEEPGRSVISIAYAVGFNTKSTFYNAFSRFTGKSPQDFRKEKCG